MEPVDEAKARRKEMHRKSMILTGAIIAGSALAAWWLGFAPDAFVPKLRLGAEGPRPDLEATLKPGLVKWREFSPQALREAKKLDRLVLLNLSARWASASRIMDGTTFADPGVAKLAERELVAVRVDADERPDLVLRYLGKGWPTTLLLLPSGEILADGTFMSAAIFTRWVGEIGKRFHQRRAGVADVAADVRAKPAPAAAPFDAGKALDASHRALEATWAGPGLFARYDRLSALTRLKAAWAPALTRRGAEAAKTLQAADGGFYRARGWSLTVDEERRLGDQADALAYLSTAEPAEAAKLRSFIATRLTLPGGGYRAAVWPGGEDDRVFCDESSRMAAAFLRDPSATKAQKEQARRTVALFWAARQRGLARRRAEQGARGLLGDQLGLLEGLLAADRRADAAALADALDRELFDASSGAYLDRPATGELSGPLDRIPFAGLNARARRDLAALGRTPRAETLGAWLRAHPQGLDAGELAELAQ